MSAFVSGDRVRWNGETFVVSSVFNTNTEGWRVNLVAVTGGDSASVAIVCCHRVTVPVSEVEKMEGA